MVQLNYRDPDSGNYIALDIVGVPTGTVVAFAGTAAPDGWHLCDGTAHGSAKLETILGSSTTPNLQDRFVVGVGPSYAAKATGGAATVTLSPAQSGNSGHTHGVTSGTETVNHYHGYTTSAAGDHNHTGGYRALAIRNTDLSQTTGGEHVLSHTAATQSNWPAVSHSHAAVNTSNPTANHSHYVYINASGDVAATAAHENMPPFYALAFIIKT